MAADRSACVLSAWCPVQSEPRGKSPQNALCQKAAPYSGAHAVLFIGTAQGCHRKTVRELLSQQSRNPGRIHVDTGMTIQEWSSFASGVLRVFSRSCRPSAEFWASRLRGVKGFLGQSAWNQKLSEEKLL